MKIPSGTVLAVLLIMLASSRPASPRTGLILSARGEWSLSGDRRKIGQVIQGSNGSGQSYQFTLDGQPVRGLHFSSSASLSRWSQKSKSQFVPDFLTRTDALSNMLSLFPERTFSLTMRQRISTTESALPIRYSSWGGTLKGVIFPKGPRFTMDVEKLSQKQESSISPSTVVTDQASLRLEQAYRRLSFESVNSWSRVHASNADHSSWAARVRPVYRFSPFRHLTGSYSLQSSAQNLGQSASLDFVNRVSNRRGFSLGANYAASRFPLTEGKSQRFSSGGLNLSAQSNQALGRRIEHTVDLSARAGVEWQSLPAGDQRGESWQMTLGNNFRRIQDRATFETGYAVSLADIPRRTTGLGSRHEFKIAGNVENEQRRFRTNYSLSLERTDLRRTIHALESEFKSLLNSQLSFETSGRILSARAGSNNSMPTGQNRELSLRSGMEWRNNGVTAFVTYQIQQSSAPRYKNLRHFTTTSVTWRVSSSTRLESQGNILFESISRLRSYDVQTALSSRLALLEVSLTLKYQYSRSFATKTSGGSINFKIARSLRQVL